MASLTPLPSTIDLHLSSLPPGSVLLQLSEVTLKFVKTDLGFVYFRFFVYKEL